MSRPLHRIMLPLALALLAAAGFSADDTKPEQPTDGLAHLLEADPVAGFQQAWQAVKQAEDKNDLDRMVEVLEVVGRPARRFGCPAIVDRIARKCTNIAQARGRWDLLGHVYAGWATDTASRRSWTTPAWDPVMLRRAKKLAELSAKAAERAGQPPPEGLQPFLNADTRREAYEQKLIETLRQKLPADMADLAEAACEATMDLRDEEAIQQATALLREVSRSREGLSDTQCLLALAVCSRFLSLPGGSEVASMIQSLLEQTPVTATHQPVVRIRTGPRSEPVALVVWLLGHAVLSWDGTEDVFLRQILWAMGPGRVVEQGTRHRPPMLNSVYFAIRKLFMFGRHAEANYSLSRYVAAAERLPWEDRLAAYYHGPCCIGPQTPTDLRRLVTQRCLTLHATKGHGNWRQVSWWEQLCGLAAPDWKPEMAQALWDAALQGSNITVQVEMLEEAARLYDEAGLAPTAVQARALAKSISSQKPQTVTSLALARARKCINANQWQQALEALEIILANEQPGKAVFDALVLAHKAHDALGHTDQAMSRLMQAENLLGQLQLSDVARTNHLITLAAVTKNRSNRLSLLKRARETAGRADVELLRRKVDDRLATAALDMGDLPAAQSALLEIVNRREEKRQRLAFDPQLRQQWFADNIEPYRKLMRVAALRNDPYLALSCGERMRSRALLDQLAWQKVDMAVELLPQEQRRLAEVRQMRQRVRYLLQHVLGGAGIIEEPAEARSTSERGKYMPIRGQYMPIRGMYMPIRGPLGEGEPATAADGERLKSLLAELAQEEAALESAIREAVPAYAHASQMVIPTGQELVDAISADPRLAVLQYTLSDEGLVVVAIGPGGVPQVALIQLRGDDLWERIGTFREMIWERKDEAFDEAKKLYELLVSPVASALAGADRLWVIADGALQLLPFNSLIGREGVFLGYYHAIATAPSLTLALQSRGERQPAGNSAVVVAAPDTGFPDAGTQVAQLPEDKRGMYMPIRGMYMPIRGMYMPIRGESGVSSALTSMAMIPLPGAKAEGEAIVDRFEGATLLTGEAATKSALMSHGGNCDILHLATHGYADPELPELSGLLLAADGEKLYDVLTAGEVYTWPLRARLVTLSACQTALGKNVEGEGLIGLTRAFIYAGAQDVLCTLWPVSDESTKRLMTELYDRLRGGATVEVALQAAQKSLMRAEDTNHPFYWAGFAAVRGPE